MSSLVRRSVLSIHWARFRFFGTPMKVASSLTIRQPIHDIYQIEKPILSSYLLARHLKVSASDFTIEKQQDGNSKSNLKESSVEKPPLANNQQDGEDKNNVKESGVQSDVKLSLFQRFKQMSKDYWYVLIPVHIVTSVGWFGGFYFAVKRYVCNFHFQTNYCILVYSGLDVVTLLENLGVSEKIINPLKGSSAGYVALAYVMYKVATPARYTVTLGKIV